MKAFQINRRDEARVEIPFVIKFRDAIPLFLNRWDISCVKNISKSGILLYVFQHHKGGSQLELKLEIPMLNEESNLWANVIRCRSRESEGIYELAATLLDSDEETRREFNTIMDSLLKNKK